MSTIIAMRFESNGCRIRDEKESVEMRSHAIPAGVRFVLVIVLFLVFCSNSVCAQDPSSTPKPVAEGGSEEPSERGEADVLREVGKIGIAVREVGSKRTGFPHL